jgi:predicted phosphate transport protein (TIGR00153 family)
MLDKQERSRIRISSYLEEEDPMGWFQKGERPASLKERFFSKDKSFQKMLAAQAAKTVEGIEALGKFMQKPDPENAKRVREIEQEADELRRVVVEELDKSFVTPIDREDIFNLSRTVDDMVDYADTTVDEMEIYEVMPDKHLLDMVDILRKEAREILDSIRMLDTYPHIAMEHAVQAKVYENLMEKAYHAALADLFKRTDTIYMLKMREIYRHLSNAADRGDQAANTICNIVMKAT